MPDSPHLQAERAFVQANDREVDFCPFRGPGARLPHTDTIPLLAAEINLAFGGDQEQAHGLQSETNSSQNGIDGRVARCATRGQSEIGISKCECLFSIERKPLHQTPCPTTEHFVDVE